MKARARPSRTVSIPAALAERIERFREQRPEMRSLSVVVNDLISEGLTLAQAQHLESEKAKRDRQREALKAQLLASIRSDRASQLLPQDWADIRRAIEESSSAPHRRPTEGSDLEQ